MQNVSNDLFNQALAITTSNTVNHAWTFDAFLVGGAVASPLPQSMRPAPAYRPVSWTS